MLFFWTFYSSKNPEKNSFRKNMKQEMVFIIDNNQKCFLSSKSVYYNDFWGSCDTEDWSN